MDHEFKSAAVSHHPPFHARHLHPWSVFGNDWFALKVEAFARFLGTSMFLVAQHSEALSLAGKQREKLASEQTARLSELTRQNTELTRNMSERIHALTEEGDLSAVC